MKGIFFHAKSICPSPVESRQKTIYQEGDTNRPKEVQYIGGLFKGTLRHNGRTDEKSLSFIRTRLSDTPYNKSKRLETGGRSGQSRSQKSGSSSPVKYIFILSREQNYDTGFG